MCFLVDGCIAGRAGQLGHGGPDTIGILFGEHDRDFRFLAGEQERLVPFQDYLDIRIVRDKPRLHVDHIRKRPVLGNQFLACFFLA